MKINNLSFTDSLYKFKISDEIKEKLSQDDFIILSEVGLPSKILSNTFVYNEAITVDEDGDLILGYNSHVNEWKLKISVADYSIFYAGKGKLTEAVNTFYNSSVSQLMFSLFSYDFFIRRLINSNSFGEYHDHHEKYANMLFELITDIDQAAVEKGVWFSLIDEMKLGVI